MTTKKEDKHTCELFKSISPNYNEKHIEWHKLASVDLSDLMSSRAVDNATLEEHFSYIASCDAVAELDMTKAADRRTLLKMFRISQLLLQRLMRAMLTTEQCAKKVKQDLTVYTQKYERTKAQLVQQIMEAKKMKKNNNNLRDTVKYINSVAIMKGIIEPLKCSFCSKIFREVQYLESHVERKHGNQRMDRSEQNELSHIDLMDASMKIGDKHSKEQNSEELQQEKEYDMLVPNLVIDRKCLKDELQFSKNDNKNDDSQSCKTPPLQSIKNQTNKDVSADSDASRVLEIEQQYERLNNIVHEMIENFKIQKMGSDSDRLKYLNDIHKLQKEKITSEDSYKTQFQILSSKIEAVANNSSITNPPFSTSNQTDTNLQFGKNVDKVSVIQAKLIANRLQQSSNYLDYKDSFEDKSDGNEAYLSSITEMSAENDSDEVSVSVLTAATYDQNNILANNDVSKSSLYTIKTMEKSSQLPTHSSNPYLATTDVMDARGRKVISVRTTPETEIVKSQSINRKLSFDRPQLEDNVNIETVKSERERSHSHHRLDVKVRDMYSSSDLKDSEETSSNESLDNQNHRGPENEGKEESSISNVNHQCHQSPITNVTNLHDLLKENPTMWKQLRDATNEVVNDRLISLGVGIDEAINMSTYKSALRNLQRRQKELGKKYPNIKKIRKSINHKLSQEIKERSAQENIEIKPSKLQKRKSFNAFKSASRNFKSKLQKKSFNKIQRGSAVSMEATSKIQDLQSHEKIMCEDDESSDESSYEDKNTIENNNKRESANLVVNTSIETVRAASLAHGKDVSVESDETDSENLIEHKEVIEAVIDVHNEHQHGENTMKRSIQRNTPGPVNKLASEFEDKYDIIGNDSSSCGTDNDGFSEGSLLSLKTDETRRSNTKFHRPPRKIDTIIHDEPDDNVDCDHYNNNTEYEYAEYKPIKLKQATGSNIMKLKESIEAQLRQRSVEQKPAGSVDTVAQVHGTDQRHTRVTKYSMSSSDDEY